MDFSHKNIGIWGFGIVGQSAARFFYNQNAHVTVVDQKPPTPAQQELLAKLNATYTIQTTHTLSALAEQSDYIIVSPGIDLRPYPTIQAKLLPELDIFAHYWRKPIIAVTGTIGKTSVTHLLTAVLRQTDKQWINGGNIGVGMLDLLDQQKQYDGVILELSSFQLEYCRSFAPTLAIWTNLYPNHLDRHTTLENYSAAKMNSVAHQNSQQHALLPLQLLDYPHIAERIHSIKSKISFFAPEKPHTFPPSANTIFWIDNDTIVSYHNGIFSPLVELHTLPEISFKENWLIICATTALLNGAVPPLKNLLVSEKPLEHRLEKVAVINGITFYNDSKSTVPEATLAALRACKNPIVLLLGGVSKGIDRTPFIASLAQFPLRRVIAFGKEAEFIKKIAVQNNVPCCAVSTLEEAVAESVRCAQTDDIILFSPAGASFDLFANYQERGTHFKQLIAQLTNT